MRALVWFIYLATGVLTLTTLISQILPHYPTQLSADLLYVVTMIGTVAGVCLVISILAFFGLILTSDIGEKSQ